MFGPEPTPTSFTASNAREAGATRMALDAYLTATGDRIATEARDLEHQFAELVASLYHCINRAGLDPRHVQATAMRNYLAELHGEHEESRTARRRALARL